MEEGDPVSVVMPLAMATRLTDQLVDTEFRQRRRLATP